MNKVYDKTEFLKYMNKWAKELYSSSELNYWDCYYALQTMNRCIAEILENGDSVNIYKWWDIKPKLFKSVKRYSPLLDMEYEVPERYYPSLVPHAKLKQACTKFEERLAAGEFDIEDEDELENLLCKMQQDFMKKHPEVEEMDINFDVRVAYSFGYLTWGGSDFNLDIFVWQDGHDDVVEEYDEIPLNLGEDGTREVKKVIWEALGKMLLNI